MPTRGTVQLANVKAQSAAVKKAKSEHIDTALGLAWNNTQRLRTDAGDNWAKNMAAFVKAAAEKHNVPYNTLKYHFKLRLDDHQGKRKKKVTRGVLTKLEMQSLYEWVGFMGKQYLPPTRLELRSQVLGSSWFTCILV
jgi:hypothetical protein